MAEWTGEAAFAGEERRPHLWSSLFLGHPIAGFLYMAEVDRAFSDAEKQGPVG
jgi:hypothetical protein